MIMYVSMNFLSSTPLIGLYESPGVWGAGLLVKTHSNKGRGGWCSWVINDGAVVRKNDLQDRRDAWYYLRKDFNFHVWVDWWDVNKERNLIEVPCCYQQFALAERRHLMAPTFVLSCIKFAIIYRFIREVISKLKCSSNTFYYINCKLSFHITW